MRFKNDQFRIWLEAARHMTLEEFSNLPQQKRAVILDDFMKVNIGTTVIVMSGNDIDRII